MKLNFVISIIGLLLVGCTDKLELTPPSSATELVFYKTESDFLQATNAVYADLKSYPTRVLDLSETRSDNIYGSSDDGKRYWDDINNFSSSLASNSKIQSAWTDAYSGVFKANTLLAQLESVGESVLDKALREQLEGEARFLRAFYYFDLLRTFGGVPIISEVVTAVEAESISRSPAADVYELIIDDLKFAVDHLPNSYPADEVGHATSYAAKGILALVYMTRSGKSYGIDGPGMETNEWSTAATLLDDIIQSEQFDLAPTYGAIFDYGNENNEEVIFDVQYIAGGLGLGGEYPSLFLPDAYVQQIAGFVGGVMVRPPSEDLIASYSKEDKRLDQAVQFGYTASGRFDNRPMLVKFVDPSQKGTRWTDWPLNFIVLRYTDVLLLRAECTLRGASGNMSDVVDVVNKVRERAGVNVVESVDLDFLMEERRREFIGEGIRWHDLVRSGLVVSTMNAWISTDDNKKVMSPMKEEFIIYPVPQAELNVKPGLYEQNKGYN